MNSPAWRLNAEDVRKWIKNMLVFLAPLFVIYINSVVDNIGKGLTLSQSFVLSPTIQGALVLYTLNAVLDLLRKLAKGS